MAETESLLSTCCMLYMYYLPKHWEYNINLTMIFRYNCLGKKQSNYIKISLQLHNEAAPDRPESYIISPILQNYGRSSYQ